MDKKQSPLYQGYVFNCPKDKKITKPFKPFCENPIKTFFRLFLNFVKIKTTEV